MKIHHYASHLADANLTIVNTEHTTIETLESLRENLKYSIDLYIDSLIKQTKDTSIISKKNEKNN
jgi:predicted RNase H-like HicB family nuclease